MRKMKKLAALLLAGVFALGTLSGCGNGSQNTAAQAGNQESGTTAEQGDKKVKIGLSIYSTTDATAGPLYEQMKTATEALGGELVVAIDDSDLDKQITNLENFIASGCDAVFCLPYADDAIPRIVSMCENEQTYFGFYWYALGDETLNKMCFDSEYFIGHSYEDDVWSAYAAMTTLHNAGADKIGFFGLPKGRYTTDLRDQGIQQACEEYGMEILVEDRVNVYTSDEAASSVESFISSYPDMEGIIIGGQTQTCLPGIIQTLKTLGLDGKIKVSAIDFHENQTEYYEEGSLNGIIGGHATGPSWLAIVTVNKVQGTPLTDGPVGIEDKFIVLESVEDAENYDAYLFNELPYTTEEFAEMNKKTNPDFTYDDLLEIINSYSIDDVMTRHGYK